MTFFNSVFNKIQQSISNNEKKLTISGISQSQWCFIFSQYIHKSTLSLNNTPISNYLFLCDTIDSSENLYQQFSSSPILKDSFRIMLFPGLEVNPYSSAISSERNLFKRFKLLNYLSAPDKPTIIISTLESLLLKIPSKSFFQDNSISIELSDIISPQNLASNLVKIGYRSSTSVEEPGTFTSKGEIFDIYPNNSFGPVRLHYFDEMIEEIFAVDINTQKTIRDKPLKYVNIPPVPHIFSNQPFVSNFRANIPMPSPQFKEKFEARKVILNKLSNNNLFENYPAFTPQFLTESATLLDYLDPSNTVISRCDAYQIERNWLEYIEDLDSHFANISNDIETDLLLPEPSSLYLLDFDKKISAYLNIHLNKFEINQELNTTNERQIFDSIPLTLESSKAFLRRNTKASNSRFDYIKETLTFLKSSFINYGPIVFSYKHESTKDELIHLLKENEFTNDDLAKITFFNQSIEEGFYNPKENLLFISDSDFFSHKQVKTSNKKSSNLDLFAEQLATLKPGDFVIHQDHGVGSYQGLESITIRESSSDFIVIHYADKDKIYVPVYKMNLIQKHAGSHANVKVASLKNNKFEIQKSKAKASAKKLAFDLIQLQAERSQSSSFAFSPPDHLYKEFELSFPFEETKDQQSATSDVLTDMQKDKPMDRLVCGDVGFGKTEIAMRAAFKAVLDNKQVAILVPTTILALQHYNSFCKRFKDFPVKIEFLSRFRTPIQTKNVIHELREGRVDIIIGTHKLLSKEIEFSDLGLVIIDEEQRFGVAHKEQMKLLKASVDFLTLTATPIPRTLQLSFLGLKDLSLIQTAPPKRQSIKTYIIKEDDLTIKDAIEKEINRGGQVFFVHNRVHDIEILAAKIARLVPKAKIIVAHGQLPERELEKRITDFYSKKYDILLATTIIESGIDIPSANTMLINKSHQFGLSQLHQLRGRIGRAEKKAYAYFIIPNEHNLSEIASKRLQAIQTYADLGSGFSLASSDLEIRGAGDILGGEQSGHIESVGLELYMQLLQEAIEEIKGVKREIRQNVEIQTPAPSYIPDTYIEDSSLRLKYYKKLSNCTKEDQLVNLESELQDIFGMIPEELNNLFLILKSRIYLQRCGINSLKASPSKYYIQFDQKIVEGNDKLRDKILEFVLSRPKQYKINPDFSAVHNLKDPFTQHRLYEFSKSIALQIDIC